MAKWQMPNVEAFKKMSPAMRGASLIGGVAGIVMLVTIILAPPGQVLKAGVSTSETNLAIPQLKDISNERIASEQSVLQQKLAEQASSLETLKTENTKLHEAAVKPAPPDTTMSGRIDALVSQVNAISAQQDKDALNKSLPPPATAAAPAPALDVPLPPVEVVKIRVIHGDPAVSRQAEKVLAKTPEIYLPATTFFEAVTLNGMDAPTNRVAVKNPVPVIARIKSDAILPNFFLHDIKECFVLMAGYGSLASERAIIRLESIACTREDGRVMEAKIDGYLVGEDGRVGMRGRLVSKQGQLIAQSLAAGVLSGFGQAITPQATSGLNLNAGTSYASPPISAIASTAGIAHAEDIEPTVSHPNFLKGSSDGWFWYKDPKEAPPKPKEPPPAPAKPPEPEKPAEVVKAEPPKPVGPTPFSAAWLRVNMPKLQEAAIDNPTKDNVSAYYYAQRVLMDKAQNYAEKAKEVVATDPFLDENNRVPLASFAVSQFERGVSKGKDDALKSIASKGGLWVFYDSKCNFCGPQVNTVKEVAKKYGFSTKFIAMDGAGINGILPEGTWVKDAGQSKTLKVTCNSSKSPLS